MIKAVFVDIDNTILDFDAYVRNTLKTGFDLFGLRPYEDWMYEAFHEENNKLWRKIEDGSLTFAELQKIRFVNVFERLGITYDGPTFEKYFRAQLRDSAIPVEGAFELLDTLASLKQKGNGFPVICIASNGPYEQQCHRIEIGNMAKYFDYYFVSENLGASKPDAGFFEAAFKELNRDRASDEQILPEESLIIGDSLTSDMAGGIGYGMHTIYYSRNGKLPEGDIQPEKVYFSLKDISQTIAGVCA